MGQSEHTTTAMNETLSMSNLDEKPSVKTVEHSPESEQIEGNLTYDDADEEPELHARTYVALLSMFVLNLVQVFALQGPPAVVRYIHLHHNVPSDAG